jgi:hypothetical protein
VAFVVDNPDRVNTVREGTAGGKTHLTSKPGIAFPALPGLMPRGGWSSVMPVVRLLPACGTRATPEMGEPDSDDHQLSTTCAFSAPYSLSRPWYMVMMAGSDRSPARNSARRLRRPPRLPMPARWALSGSSLRMARRAVGAVNMVLILYSSTRRQKADASGVPTGLPS